MGNRRVYGENSHLSCVSDSWWVDRCKPPKKSDTVDCPINNTEAHRKYQDNSLSGEVIEKIISSCSPNAQGFPRLNFIDPVQELTSDCYEVLEDVIP